MTERRAAWRERSAAVDPARYVFLDETGTTTAMDRTYGRAPSGVRVDGPVPHGHWKVLTLTAAVRLGGVPEAACLAFDGATDTACFETYIGRCLVPAPRAGDIVVMDNLACHKTAEVERLIRSAGAEVWYLPPYSPCPYPLFNASGPRSAAASAPLIISWSLSQPRQIVIQPGSPSCFLPRKPPSLANSR